MSQPLIGIDFDNTIICYDNVFHAVALEKGLIPGDLPKNKGNVRDYLRSIGKEDDWTALQGLVYGARINSADPFPGVVQFFRFCKQNHYTVFIVSHKTRYPYMGHQYDLHKAAYGWLEFHGFFDQGKIGLCRENVFFELSKAEKINRIIQLNCSHFIDDLPEFLSEPDMPENMISILFDPNDLYRSVSRFLHVKSWEEIPGKFRDCLNEIKGET